MLNLQTERLAMWERLCVSAIRRHRLVWASCGCNPATWLLHEMMIIAVYGEDTYRRAERRA